MIELHRLAVRGSDGLWARTPHSTSNVPDGVLIGPSVAASLVKLKLARRTHGRLLLPSGNRTSTSYPLVVITAAGLAALGNAVTGDERAGKTKGAEGPVAIVLEPGASFQSIPMIPRAHYHVNAFWDTLEGFLEREMAAHGLDIDPEYQRGHVWTEEQRRKYVEYRLQGGETARRLTCVSIGWEDHPPLHYSLMDGKQRLESVRMFMRDELRVFGLIRSEFTGHMRTTVLDFEWHVVEVANMADVYRLYVTFNGGGVLHSPAELDRVRGMTAALEERAARRQVVS
jgi:hypothetical protein